MTDLLYYHHPNKEKIIDRNTRLEVFRAEHNLPQPKCISDKTLLYLRYGIHYIKADRHNTQDSHYLSDQQYEDMEAVCLGFYEQYVRGEIKYTNKTPPIVAATILYLSIITCKIWPYTRKDIAEGLMDINVVSLSKYLREMKGDFDKYMKERGEKEDEEEEEAIL